MENNGLDILQTLVIKGVDDNSDVDVRVAFDDDDLRELVVATCFDEDTREKLVLALSSWFLCELDLFNRSASRWRVNI